MEEKENTKYLGSEKIGKLMLKFSIPCVLSLLVSALYNIVDQIFIGNSELSTLGNAATGVVFPIFIISQAFAWCFGDGCAAYLNICQGKKDTQNSHKAIGTGITITLITSLILIAVFSPLKKQILTLFGASENSIGMAIEYFNWILAFFPVYMLSNMMNAVIRSDGSPAWSMISMLVGAIVNIILDPVFIFGCKWGMTGAAVATVIGQVVSFVISFIYFFRTKTFKLKLKSFIPNFKVFSNALKLGASSFITQITLDLNVNSPTLLKDLYLSSTPVQNAIVAQNKIIRKIADNGSCVIVGRAADFVLKDYENLVRIFIFAPEEYKVSRIMQVYGDNKDDAIKNVKRSDSARASYYKNISDKDWGNIHNYDLALDSSIGIEESVKIIYDYIKAKNY